MHHGPHDPLILLQSLFFALRLNSIYSSLRSNEQYISKFQRESVNKVVRTYGPVIEIRWTIWNARERERGNDISKITKIAGIQFSTSISRATKFN